MTVQAQGIEAQALQALTNLKAIVDASGSSIDKIVKTTVRLVLLALGIDSLLRSQLSGLHQEYG